MGIRCAFLVSRIWMSCHVVWNSLMPFETKKKAIISIEFAGKMLFAQNAMISEFALLAGGVEDTIV